MAQFARRLHEPVSNFETAAEHVRQNFFRFWYEETGYCFDVIDGPNGNEASLRPNQLFAISIPADDINEPALFSKNQQKAIVKSCARYLLTSHGLRSLAPIDPAYTGRYGGDTRQRDGAYHQGTVWGWLIGSFVGQYFLPPGVYRKSPLMYVFGPLNRLFNHWKFTPRYCLQDLFARIRQSCARSAQAS